MSQIFTQQLNQQFKPNFPLVMIGELKGEIQVETGQLNMNHCFQKVKLLSKKRASRRK